MKELNTNDQLALMGFFNKESKKQLLSIGHMR